MIAEYPLSNAESGIGLDLVIEQIDMEETISTSNIQRGLRGILMLNGQLSILLLHHLDQ